MAGENDNSEVSALRNELNSLKEKFNLFTTVILFALALQVVGAIYSGISIKETVNEFIDLKTQQFNQIVANDKLDPKIRLEAIDSLVAKVGMSPIRKNKFAVTFSVGIRNIGNTPASGIAIKALLPEEIETEFQSFEENEYKYEMLATPSKDSMFVPPNSIFRQLVVIPITKKGVDSMLHGNEYQIKINLYSRFGLEDERIVKLEIDNKISRHLKK